MERTYTISAFTENHPGVLHRLTTTLTRRKINIESLTVSETETHGISRFTIVVKTTPKLIKTIVKQIDRIIEVREVFASENSELLFKELAFFRVSAETQEKRPQIEEHANRYGASIIQATDKCIVVQKTGTEDEINSLYHLLEPLGIQEFLRSGRIAIRKEEADLE